MFWLTLFANTCLSLSEDIVRLFMQYGVYVNGCLFTQSCSLAYTVQRGYENLVKYLLNKGADINL